MDQELTLEQSAAEVMRTLPPVIRNYVTQGKYTPVAQNLMRQYKLRIDQGGVLEREILMLLLGLEDPAEFVKSLIEEGGLDKAVVDTLTRDINNQIFIPLRAEEMKAASAAKAQEGQEPHFKLQNKIPLPSRPLPPRPVAPAPSVAARPAIPQKPFDPSHMLEDHEEPHIDLGKPRPVPPPPPNLPGQMPPAAATQTPAKPAPPPPAGLKFTPPTMPSPGRYSVDPYREPIDEEGK